MVGGRQSGKEQTQMAGVYKRGKTWYGRVTRGGKEHRRSLETSSKSVAEERFRKWLDELKATDWGGRPRRTFDEAAQRFVAEHFKTIREKSAKRYMVSLNNLTDHFQGVYLDDIDNDKLLQFEMKRRDAKVSSSTIRRDLACLGVMLSLACDMWRWADSNSVPKFLKKRGKTVLKEGKPRTRYLDHDEERRTLISAGSHSMLHAAIIFAIDVGARDHEQLGLRWPQINLAKKEVTLAGKGGKTRVVPLLPRVLAMLAALPRHSEGKYVFWHDDGVKYLRLYRPLQTALKRAGVTDHVQWHDLRRTCGCRLLQDHRMPMEQVSRWLGHSSVAVTEKHYAFLKVDQLHASVGNLVAHLYSGGSATAQNSAQESGLVGNVEKQSI
jgi:integrase